VLRQILQDHGHQALAKMAGRVPQNVWEAARHALELMLTCGTPAAGFVRLRCGTCGEQKVVAFTCKSRLCPSCGWLYGQRFAERVRPRLIGGRYRHLVFAVPSELRELFFWERQLLPLVCHAAAAATLEFFQKRCKKHELVPGIIATTHTFGRDLSFHVHAHLLVTQGALQRDGVWQPVRFFPAQEFRRRWQYHLLTLLRRQLPAEHPAQACIDGLFQQYPTGFIVNVESVYNNVDRAIKYCCRYLARPPLGERRILEYDGEYVTFEYKDYKAGGRRGKAAPQRRHHWHAQHLVEMLLQHVAPRYARNIHYYGLYRTQVWRKWFDQVRSVSQYPQNVGGPQTKPLSWRERIIKAFETDPVACPSCGTSMVVVEVRGPPRRRASSGPLQLPLPLPAG